MGPSHSIIAMVGEDVLLPCYLSPNISAESMTIRWVVNHSGARVHICEDGLDKNDQQGAAYRGRTALFRDRLRRGDASLKLTNVKVSDEGDYTCSFQDGTWYRGISLRIKVEGKKNSTEWDCLKVVCGETPYSLVRCFSGEDS